MGLRAFIWFMLLPGGLLAQTAQLGQSAVAAVNAVGSTATGQNRGVRAVTRRTSMIVPGMEARSFFTAGGVDLGAGATMVSPVNAPPVPLAETAPPELQSPEVQSALRQLAAAGDIEAKSLLSPRPPMISAASSTIPEP